MRYALLPDSPAGPSKTTHLSRQLFSLSAFLILVMSTEAETSLTIACSVFRSVPLDSDGLIAVAFLIETRLLPTFARSYARTLLCRPSHSLHSSFLTLPFLSCQANP